MMLNPNMTLEEFARMFGGFEPAPWQRRMMQALEKGVPPPRMLNAHPYRPSRDDRFTIIDEAGKVDESIWEKRLPRLMGMDMSAPDSDHTVIVLHPEAARQNEAHLQAMLPAFKFVPGQTEYHVNGVHIILQERLPTPEV